MTSPILPPMPPDPKPIDGERVNPYERLESFRKLERGWDSYGAAPIDDHCIDKAREFLATRRDAGEWTPVPSCDGGVALVKYRDGFEMELSITRAAP